MLTNDKLLEFQNTFIKFDLQHNYIFIHYPQRQSLQSYPILSCINPIVPCVYTVLSCLIPNLSCVFTVLSGSIFFL